MTMGLPKIPKLSDAHRSESPIEKKKIETVVEDHNSNGISTIFKVEPEIVTDQIEVKEEPTDNTKVSKIHV